MCELVPLHLVGVLAPACLLPTFPIPIPHTHTHTHIPSFTRAASFHTQAEKDNQLVRVLRDILDCLQTEAVDETTFVTLEESCLVPVLENALSNDSLLDMNRHAVLYAAVFQLVGRE